MINKRKAPRVETEGALVITSGAKKGQRQHNRTTVPPRTNCEVSHAKCFEVPAASTVVSACRLQQDEPHRVRTDGSNSDDQLGTDECDSRVLSGFGSVSAHRIKRAVVTRIVGKRSLNRARQDFRSARCVA